MERFTWTIAYRKRTANRFLRVTNWSGSWAQALAMAQLFGEANPDLQVWYTSSRDAELKGGVSIEDVANIMVDSGKRIRIVEGGELPAEMIARIPAPDVARQRWIDRKPIAEPVPLVDATALNLINRIDEPSGASVGMFRGVMAFRIGWPRELADALRKRGDAAGADELLRVAATPCAYVP